MDKYEVLQQVMTTNCPSLSDRRVLAYQLASFLDDAGAARQILVNRATRVPPIATSLYESFLTLKSDSPQSRSAVLYALASLYSWALTVGKDIDAILLRGLGLAVADVSAFSMWLRSRLGRKGGNQLSAKARANHNQILHWCRQTCIHFITQYAPVDVRSIDRVRQVELVVRSQERAWRMARIKTRRQSIAPDLTDDELQRIERFLHPKNRASIVGEAVANRDYLIWRLTIEFGLRIGEILALRLADCPAPGRSHVSVVRIDERDDGVVDPRGVNAPRPKTLSRDLQPLWPRSPVLGQIGTYSTQFRRARVKVNGRYVHRWVLSHPYLIVTVDGRPLSISSVHDIADEISRSTGIDFHWHLGRHAFFNRMYTLARTNQEMQDLVYWGGWESEKSLLIYSRRARANRARGVLRTENEKWEWMALN